MGGGGDVGVKYNQALWWQTLPRVGGYQGMSRLYGVIILVGEEEGGGGATLPHPLLQPPPPLLHTSTTFAT